MEAISKEKIASVLLLTAKISEDEMAVYEAALSYVLDTLDEAEIEHRFGASRDEIEGMCDDLREALAEYGDTTYKSELLAKNT
jgi:hypothetical protein